MDTARPFVPSTKLVTKFYSNIEVKGEDDCWTFDWRGCGNHGYGVFYIPNKEKIEFAGTQVLSNRFALMIKLGFVLTEWALHTCDNKPCCNPKHLYEGTDFQNKVDIVTRGTASRGEAHPRAILSEQDVIAIRKSKLSQYKLATKYGVSRTTIEKVLHYESWLRV